ncbi:MAG TPA: RNA polymerase sigma factor region1.1 domain-containing protein, partial [Luteolibacter sp.]
MANQKASSKKPAAKATSAAPKSKPAAAKKPAAKAEKPAPKAAKAEKPAASKPAAKVAKPAKPEPKKTPAAKPVKAAAAKPAPKAAATAPVKAEAKKPAAKPAPKVEAKKPEPKKPESKAPAKAEAKQPEPKKTASKQPEPAKADAAAPKATKTSEASKRRIDTPEIQEKIRELIKLAKEQEYLTYDDINEILPNDLVDPEDVEAIMERLRNMEFDIIDASEVDRFKDKKRDEADGDEEDVKADQKLDILDDPVRMYLKQMGQFPLLTREQEVEISKRIEDAEIEVAKQLHLFGFTAECYLELADKLNKGKERFDRVILDKKIESRERYMKILPKQCDQLKQLHEENDDLFRQLSAKNPRGKKKL